MKTPQNQTDKLFTGRSGWFSRILQLLRTNTWMVKLFKLPACRTTPLKKGLILIQIDGLSFEQMESALMHNKLPFLQKLLTRNKTHVKKPVYSGLPSSTPAFQAELLYGVKSFVPAFEFIDREKGQRHVCFNPESADHLAKQLSRQGTGLLKDGNAYALLFSGGAKEARYCSETMGLNTLVQSLNPLRLLLVALLHLDKLLRLAVYTLVECLLAVFDFFRGLIKGQDMLKEFTFLPARIVVCIILRELVRMRMKMDITRGVPVLCANFLGYDEQAHRRGPASSFAHWSLKGIDQAIRDIYITAGRSPCMDYEIVIYSDHGQERVSDYHSVVGESVKTVVPRVLEQRFSELFPQGRRNDDKTLDSLYRRMRSFFLRRFKSRDNPSAMTGVTPQRIQVTTMGPLGHVYLPRPLPEKEMPDAAADLVHQAHIPMVLFRQNRQVTAVTRQGIFRLPDQARDILGSGYPWPERVSQDMVRVVNHPNAGDFVLSGWTGDGSPMSFNRENGAHGGPGSAETHAFAILPHSLVSDRRSPLRAMDLRALIQRFLGNADPDNSTDRGRSKRSEPMPPTASSHQVPSDR